MEGRHLVVRNTFIDAVEPDDPDGGPSRTQSDPTGGRNKNVMPLGRVDWHPPRTPLPEGSPGSEEDDVPAEDEDDDDEEAPLPGSSRGGGEGDVTADDGEYDGEDDEEDDDDGGLARTVSVHPFSLFHKPQKVAAGSQITLNSLLPEQGPAGADAAAAAAAGAMAMAPYAIGWGCPGGYGEMWPGYGPMYYAPQYGVPDAGYSAAGADESRVMDPTAVAAFGMGGGLDDATGPGEMASEESATAEGKRGSARGGGRNGKGASSAAVAAAGAAGARGATVDGPPPVGLLHRFHQETNEMGVISPDFRTFTKMGYEGRLTLVTEAAVHSNGVHRYLVQFSSGELSRADGVGFVFSSRLPCPKNIQRIISIFLNQRGRICMRIFADIVRAHAYVKHIELGDWVEMVVNLDKQVVTFKIWPRTPSGWPAGAGRPASIAEFPFGNRLNKLSQVRDTSRDISLNTGHLACVVKNVGVTVMLAS